MIFFIPLPHTTVASTDVSVDRARVSEELRLEREIIYSGLEFPTAMAFLAPNDILVLEQGGGTVQRISNGQKLDEPVLDVNVVNNREKYGIHEERGLLGIAVAAHDGNSNTPRYVFLYYTEAEGKDGGIPLGNRLYRYELIGDKLVNARLLLDLPVSEDNPAHNGGAVAIGPDDNIYVIIGNLAGPGLSDDVEETLDQNVQNGKDPDGRGGILRVTQEGEVADNEGLLGDGHPLDKYFAYGIRNSFGLAFDPLTGNLWDTENGGYDEINLVEPGFNSGWTALSGLSDDSDVLEGLIDFDGSGIYSDPELELGSHVVPTALTFFDSNRFGYKYENDLFVASATGNIFHFELSDDRRELRLYGDLEDKRANNFDELEDAIFASNLGIVTDLEVGPDGYLYGTKYEKNGFIFRLNVHPVLEDILDTIDNS